MSDNSLTLAQKIAKAGDAVGGKLKADKRNQEQRYDYVSADKILAECGQALFQQGVTIVPSIVAHDIQAVERQGKNPRLDATVEMVMKVTDGVTAFEEPWCGFGSDYMTPDKAVYKAITSGHRYFLAKLLCVGEGNEDAEHEVPEPEPAQQRPNGSKPTPPPATAEAAPAMTIEEAEAEFSPTQNMAYGAIETEQLTYMLNRMAKVKQPTDEQARKIAAVKAILAARANGRAAIVPDAPEAQGELL